MTDSNAGQRKMMRKMKPTSGGMHDTLMSAKQLRRNTAFEKGLVKSESPASKPVAPVIRRAAKKQIKTREERAARREQA